MIAGRSLHLLNPPAQRLLPGGVASRAEDLSRSWLDFTPARPGAVMAVPAGRYDAAHGTASETRVGPSLASPGTDGSRCPYTMIARPEPDRT